MPKANSTTLAKPAKPYEGFPLFAHATKRWAKKIRGQLHYFGPWSDPDGALAKYLAEKDALHAGLTPRADTCALTVKELVNAFLNEKKERVKSGELSPRTWQDYKDSCDEVMAAFNRGRRLVDDLRPVDFANLRKRISRKWGLHRLAKTIQCIRSTFKYGYEAELIDKPIRFGPGFKKPNKKTMRIEKGKQGAKLFTRQEILLLLLTAPVHIEAMLLLGINAGLGNSDCGNLPLAALDLDGGWLDFPRPKTGAARRAPLWPETVAALKEALAARPTPRAKTDANLVFLTQQGRRWAKDTNDSPISKEVAKLLHALGINGRKGLGFYTLRHVFRTVADEARDQPATDHIMGHESAHMSAHYRERISDNRLKAVSDHVRNWLFGNQTASVQ